MYSVCWNNDGLKGDYETMLANTLEEAKEIASLVLVDWGVKSKIYELKEVVG